MALDPRIILGLDTSSPLKDLTQGFGQGQQLAANAQKMQAFQEDRDYQAGQRQELAEANEYKRLAPLWGKDPQAWIEATQASSVLDDEDKQQALGMNDDMFKSLDAGVNRMLGVKPQKLGMGDVLVDELGNTVAEGKGEDQGKQKDRDLRARSIAVQEASLKERQSKLTAGMAKALLDSQDRTVIAQRNANLFENLANDFTRLSSKLEGGIKSTFSETLKGILGTQDDVTEFRRKFNKVRLSEGLKNLPPGPATDRDVKEAFKGVPKENASPEQVASFLRGAAKLSRFEAGYNQFKSDYISNNRDTRGMNKAWRKSVESPALNRTVTIAEIYATAQSRGVTPEDVRAELGL